MDVYKPLPVVNPGKNPKPCLVLIEKADVIAAACVSLNKFFNWNLKKA